MFTNIPICRELVTAGHIRGHSKRFTSGIKKVIPDGSSEKIMKTNKTLLSNYKTENYIKKIGII